MESFDISAISGANQTTNVSILSELNGADTSVDLSCSNLSVSQQAELSIRLATSERNLKWFKLETERQLAHLKADVHDKDERASRLEIQLAETSSRADAFLQSLNDDVSRLNEQKRQLESERLTFLELNADLSADLDRKRNELANVKMQLTLAEDKATKSMSNLERQTAEYRLLQGKYNMTKKRLLEAAKLKARVEALESENDRIQQEGSAKMRLSSELQQLSELERENLRLKNELGIIRQHNENVDVLREKVSHLTSTLETAKADLTRLSTVETENNFLKEKLRLLGVSPDLSGAAPLGESSQALSDRIRTLESSAKADAGEIASLREALFVHRDAKKRLTEELEHSRDRIAQLERKFNEESDGLTLAKTQLAMCSSERDSYRNLLQMIEKHLGFTGSPLSAQVAAHVRVPTQIRELEAAFESHKTEVARIRNELLVSRGKVEASEEELKNLREELTKCQTNLETKTNEVAVLRDENSRYASLIKASSGLEPCLDEEEAADKRGPIFHLKSNPADNAFREWLTDEAISLEQQRRAQKSGGDAGSVVVDVITSAEVEDLRRRIDALERAIERKEKDLKVTREMAAFSLKELNTAVTHLIGYELNLNAADKIYSLRSAYAEPSEMFLFKPRHNQKTGAISFQILETEMARRFKDSVELYVIQHQSIPAFLASVTTDLFSKQTLIA